MKKYLSLLQVPDLLLGYEQGRTHGSLIQGGGSLINLIFGHAVWSASVVCSDGGTAGHNIEHFFGSQDTLASPAFDSGSNGWSIMVKDGEIPGDPMLNSLQAPER